MTGATDDHEPSIARMIKRAGMIKGSRHEHLLSTELDEVLDLLEPQAMKESKRSHVGELRAGVQVSVVHVGRA